MTRQRHNYLQMSDYRLLNEWCRLLNDMFSQDTVFGCYMVGGVLTDPNYHDVDLRLIIPDDVYAARYDDKKRKYLNLAISIWGQKVTGLPIDFQIQPQSLANERYPGASRRHPMGDPRFDTAEV